MSQWRLLRYMVVCVWEEERKGVRARTRERNADGNRQKEQTRVWGSSVLSQWRLLYYMADVCTRDRERESVW